MKNIKVKKRDGSIVDFDKRKITNAIAAAMIDVDGTLYETDTAYDIADEIEHMLSDGDLVPVEWLQDEVEKYLMRSERPDVARAYIRYRYKREVARECRAEFLDAIGDKLEARHVVNQNANVDEQSFGGRIGEAASVMMKQYALDNLVSSMARKNHLENMIYIHDLDHYAIGDHNCLTIPFDDLLAKGFNTRQTDVRPANSINTAMQLVAVIFQLQSLQQFGGVSASHLDWTMVPYVRKSFYKHFKDAVKYLGSHYDAGITDADEAYSEELLEVVTDTCPINEYPVEPGDMLYDYAMDLTQRELDQAVEGMYHNLNTLQSRSGNQLPFTSINYGTCTLMEGRMVTKSLIEGSIKGVGRLHRTSIFPCGIFQMMKGVNRKPGDPNYDLYRLALQSTAKRLYPNYANIDWSGNAGYDINDPCTYFSTMGCRTANGLDINGLGQRKDGRGNICPVTIILPTLAMMAKEWSNGVLFSYKNNELIRGEGKTVVDYFMEILDEKIYEAKDMLLERFEWICSQSAASAKFMYENHTMAGYNPDEGIRSALKHGTIVIGQLGLAEALQILIGCDHTEERGMALAKQIEQLFKDRCAQFKQEYKLNFGVYYTPAENLCYTALKKFKDKYGVIPNVSDKEFFTNSIHVPVWHHMSPFDKIDIESQLTGYSNAGCITYVELDSAIIKNLDALEEIINYAMDHDIPYFAVNVPNDTCLDCGYTGEFNEVCPACGSESIQQLRRVTGYLTGNYTTAFNLGKQDEVHHRVKHGNEFV